MAVKNHNFRFNMEKDNEVRAWEILHSKEVKEDFRSQNEFVIAAINDYYDRHLDKKQDSYLESREKEEAFTQNIVNAVEQKVLDNLPGLAVMYMMQQQSLLRRKGNPDLLRHSDRLLFPGRSATSENRKIHHRCTRSPSEYLPLSISRTYKPHPGNCKQDCGIAGHLPVSYKKAAV